MIMDPRFKMGHMTLIMRLATVNLPTKLGSV